MTKITVFSAGKIHHKNLASQHLERDGGHLPGHPEGPVGGGDDAEDGPAQYPGPPRSSRT